MAQVESITGERLLKVEEAAEIIGAAVGTLNRARIYGGNFPAFIKRGKSVRYKLSTVQQWMANQEEHNTTSQIDAQRAARPHRPGVGDHSSQGEYYRWHRKQPPLTRKKLTR